MAINPVPTQVVLPAAPDRNTQQGNTFSNAARTWSFALPDWGDWLNSVGSNVYNNALEAEGFASNASDSADAAANAQTAAEGFRDEAEGFRDDSQTILDSNTAIAAAVQSAAGLPSLTGKAGFYLQVNETEDGVEWTEIEVPPAGTNALPTYVNSAASGSVDLDFSLYSAFEITAVGDLTLNAINLPTDGSRASAYLNAIDFDSHTITAGKSIVSDATFNTPTVYSTKYLTSIDVSANATLVQSIRFSDDGSKAFMLDRTSQEIQEWDVSDDGTLTKGIPVFTTALDTNIIGFDFNEDGTTLYVIGYQNKRTYQFSMSTAYDIENASYDSLFSDNSTVTGSDFIFNIRVSGSTVFLLAADDVFFECNFTLGDISTLSYSGNSISVTSNDQLVSDFAINLDKSELYFHGAQSDAVFVIDMPNINTLNGASVNTSKTFDISAQSTNSTSIGLNFNLNFMYIFDNDSDDVLIYKMLNSESLSLSISQTTCEIKQLADFLVLRNV